MPYKITSPLVFIDTLESFFGESGVDKKLIVSAFAEYIYRQHEDYTGSFTDAITVREILIELYKVRVPFIDAIQWNLYVNHNANYFKESSL